MTSPSQTEPGDRGVDTRELRAQVLAFRGRPSPADQARSVSEIQVLLHRLSAHLTTAEYESQLLVGIPDGLGRLTWHAICATCGTFSDAAGSQAALERPCPVCSGLLRSEQNMRDMAARLRYVDLLLEIRGRVGVSHAASVRETR